MAYTEIRRDNGVCGRLIIAALKTTKKKNDQISKVKDVTHTR